MAEHMMGQVRTSPELDAPPALRARREAVGMTRDELADAMGVLPVEIDAWESGAIAATARETALLRWHVDVAEYERGLPPRCAWWNDQQERVARSVEVGPYIARRVAREMRAHEGECPECARAEALTRELGPAPREPGTEPAVWRTALRRHVARLPAWLGWIPQAVDAALVLAGVYGMVQLIELVNGDARYVPDRFVLLGTSALMLFATLGSRLGEMKDERPWRAATLQILGTIVPVFLALGLLGDVRLSEPEPWIAGALAAAVLTALLGNASLLEQDNQTRAFDALETGAEDPRQEREVFIRQQDTSWR